MTRQYRGNGPKSNYTTGEAARILGLSPRTVSKQVDTGVIKGFRIPGSQDRRILREELIRLLKEFGLPLDPVNPTPEERGGPPVEQRLLRASELADLVKIHVLPASDIDPQAVARMRMLIQDILGAEVAG